MKYFKLDQIIDLSRERQHLDEFSWICSNSHVAKGQKKYSDEKLQRF